MQLYIKEPCNQSWEEMQPANSGRFCGSCQKIVVDFTNMSDTEIKNHLLDQRHKNTCGKFYTTQMDRPLENKTVELNPIWFRQLPYTRQVLYMVALFFLLGVSSCDFSSGKLKNKTASQQLILTSTPDDNTTLGLPALCKSSPEAPAIQKKSTPHQRSFLTGEPAIIQDPPVNDTARSVIDKIKTRQQKDTGTHKPMIMGGISIGGKHDTTVKKE